MGKYTNAESDATPTAKKDNSARESQIHTGAWTELQYCSSRECSSSTIYRPLSSICRPEEMGHRLLLAPLATIDRVTTKTARKQLALTDCHAATTGESGTAPQRLTRTVVLSVMASTETILLLPLLLALLLLLLLYGVCSSCDSTPNVSLMQNALLFFSDGFKQKRCRCCCCRYCFTTSPVVATQT